MEYAATEQAQAAIERLHNTQLNGRPIFVREDRESGAAGKKSQKLSGLCWVVCRRLVCTDRPIDLSHIDTLTYPTNHHTIYNKPHPSLSPPGASGGGGGGHAPMHQGGQNYHAHPHAMHMHHPHPAAAYHPHAAMHPHAHYMTAGPPVMRGGRGGGGGGGGGVPVSTRVYVGNLSYEVRWLGFVGVVMGDGHD